jgi:hypothetical protein
MSTLMTKWKYGADVGHRDRQRKCQLLRADDRDRRPVRMMTDDVFDAIRRDAQAVLRWVNVAPHTDVFDQDAVDDVQREPSRIDALLLERRDDHRQVDRLRRVANAHQVLELVERKIEGLLEIFQRVQCQAGATDFPSHQRIVGIIAVGGRQIVLENQALQT